MNVLSFKSDGKATGEQMIENLIATSGYAELDGGLAIKQYVNSTVEDGLSLQIHNWEIAISVEGCSARLAVFTYTILASQANDQRIRDEIELVGRCIHSAQFSRAPGISGDYEQ